MVSVIIQRSDEPQVVRLTRDNLERESYPPGAELLVEDNWWQGVSKANNNYVCLMEPDCLVSSGYFTSMMGLFQKNPFFRKLAMLSPSVGLNNWANKIYGYHLGSNYSDGVLPLNKKSSSEPYAVEIGYAPGSIIRTYALTKVPESVRKETNLVKLSALLSLHFWNSGQRVYVNPNATYVTTEDYVGQMGEFDPKPSEEVLKLFKQESIL